MADHIPHVVQGPEVLNGAPPPPAIISPGSNCITVKLEEDNFLLWRQQVTAALGGYGLKRFIEGTQVIPPRTSPEFDQIDRQDQLLVSWILSSVSIGILPNLVGCETAKELWDTIGEYFASQTSAKVMQYKRQLQSAKKGNSSMRNYLTRVKNLWDTLQSCGCKMDEGDLIHIVLAGLGPEYEAIITSLTMQQELPSWKSTSAHLLSAEWTNRQSTSVLEENLANHQQRSQNDNNRGGRSFGYQNSSYARGRGFSGQSDSFQRGRGYGYMNRSRGRGRSQWHSFNSRPMCQLCGRMGHTVHKCHYRFDISYNPKPGQFSQNQHSYGTQSSHKVNVNMVAAVPTPNTIDESCWFPDSGASHHVTNELSNLNIGKEYHGTGKVPIGNGVGLDISHIGHSLDQYSTNTESTISDETYSEEQEVSSYSDETRKVSASKEKEKEKEKDRSEVLRITLVKPVGHLKKKLIVLDVNGLLADIVSPPPKEHKADATIAGRAIFKRPFYLEFLKFCFENFEVGVWSSRIKKNVVRVIDYLMGDMKHRLLFCWDLSQCTETGFKTLENKYKALVFKELRKIWEKHDPNLPWEKGYYNESNTLLLDDSPYKALLNPRHTSIFPHTYKFQNKSDISLAAGGDLQEYLDGLAKAENMQEYVEQHPFGQEGINERSRSWNFYLQVIDSLPMKLKKMCLST